MSEPDELSFDLETRSVRFTLDEEIYPRDAVYGAAYLFIDRCWVWLDRPEDKKISVRLKTKESEPDNKPDEAQLEALAGGFANELLNQVLRLRLGESTAKIREYYIARAFFTDATQSSIDALLAELDAEELEEDDLEIAVPWQQEGAGG